MNDSKNSSNGLLVLRIPQVLSQEQVDQVTETVTPLADKLGLEPIVLCNGADLRIENGRDALLERVCVALEALVAQGQPPEVNEAHIAPQSLNPRSRSWPPGVTCNGSVRDGTGCGQCEQCQSAMRNQGLNTRD